MPAPSRIIQRQGYKDSLDLRIERAAVQGWGEAEHEFEQIYSTLDSKHEQEGETAVSGLGLWTQKTSETENVGIDTIYQGYTVYAVHTEWENSFGIAKATDEDDKEMHGVLGEQLASDLMQRGRETIEMQAAVPFNLAASATGFSPWAQSSYGSGYLGDGVAMLSTAHPLPVGGTWSNTPSTATNLSQAALEAAEIAMNQTVNYRGLLQPYQPKTLVYPIQSKFLAQKLNRTGSPQTPFTDQNTKNYIDYDLVCWSRLTNSSAWFLLSQKAEDMHTKGHLLRYYVRIAPQFRTWVNQDNMVRRGAGRARFSFIAGDSRGVYGSSST
jgi:hypothetical protein